MTENQSTPPAITRKVRRAIQRQALKNRPRGKCPFPDCVKIFVQEEGKPNACNEHRKLIADVLFVINHTTPPEAGSDKEPILFVPKPGMSDQAIQEALKKSKGGKKP